LAIVNGEWLDREARAERINLVQERAQKLRRLVESGKAAPYHVDTLREDIAELKRLKRIHRAEYDTLYFVYEYFSEEMNPDNPDNLIPAGQRFEDAASFHRELCGLLDELTRGNIDTNVAWSVGRGHAKTAYLSNAYLCKKVVYRHKRYIVEVSETTDVAGDFIQWARNQLVFNEKLRADFGELLNAKKSLNDTDNKYEFVTASGTKVEAKGIGTQMRGLRHGATRPDLFLLDDLESKENTNTPELRRKNRDWFREEMLPALSREGIAVYMGTIVHYDSVLNYVIKERRDFVSRKFPAILSWSEREDLWEQWRQIYRSDTVDARERALTFYRENEAEMLRGTQTLWPQRFTYLDLMEIRENDGAKAFNQEYLGNPIDEETQVFKPDDMTFYDDGELEGKTLDFIAAVDFAMGKEKGDYSAIVTLARNRETGVCYVYDVFLERVHPDVLLREVVERALRFQYEALAVEAQQAQEWFADKLAEELQRKGYPSATRLRKVKQRTRKALRIEALLPDIQSGRLRFTRKHRLLLEMFELYPNHNHDDGPDALAEAFLTAKTRIKRKATSTGAGR
jgi:predicted phage terminase large subunit-like protein